MDPRTTLSRLPTADDGEHVEFDEGRHGERNVQNAFLPVVEPHQHSPARATAATIVTAYSIHNASTGAYRQPDSDVILPHIYARRFPPPSCRYKKLSYRRGTARCVVSIEILPIATQQRRNYLYDKSWPNRWYEVGDLVGGNA